MKSNKLLSVMVALLVAIIPSVSEAQGLGGLLSKGKKALEKVAAKDDKADKAATDTKSVSATLANGIEIINPIAEFIEVEPIGLYGVSKSENFGDAYLVLKVLMKIPKESACFGSSIKNQKMLAVDANGKVYNIDTGGCMRYDVPEGIPVVIKIDEPAMMLQDIRKDITMMPMVKFGINIDAYHQDNLTLKNVPIFWDETPE